MFRTNNIHMFLSKKFDLSLISVYRTQIMGLAAFSILIGHAVGYGCNFDGGIIKWLLSQGFRGVDIFLFLSGMGCYYSLVKLGGGIFNIPNGLKND